MPVKSESYSEFLSRVCLHSVALIRVTAKRPEAGKRYAVDVQFRSGLRDTGGEASQAEQARFGVDFDAKVVFKKDGAQESKEQELITVRYLLEYEYEGDRPDRRILTLFSKRNVPMNVWPYFRELVSTLTQRMELPPLYIPLLVTRHVPAKTKNSGHEKQASHTVM